MKIEQLEQRIHATASPAPAPVTGLAVTPGTYQYDNKTYDDFIVQWRLSLVPVTKPSGHVWGEELIIKGRNNQVVDTVWLTPGTSYAIGGEGFVPGDLYTFGVVQIDEVSSPAGNAFYESSPVWKAAQAKEISTTRTRILHRIFAEQSEQKFNQDI